MEIHLGQIVKEEMLRQGLTPDEFARLIHTSHGNVYGIFERKFIDPALLTRISMVLNRNFFAELNEWMTRQLESSPKTPTMANSKLQALIHPVSRIVDGYFYSGVEFTKDREGLKVLLKEYFESDYRIPLLILETGYTFGAREAVKQVAAETVVGVSSAPCPKSLDMARVKAMPAKVLIDYIDRNTFDSVAESDRRLNEICRVQNGTNKKFVCIIHADPVVSNSVAEGKEMTFDQWGGEFSIFLSRNEQFFFTIYRWNRSSLLSWAKDSGLHESVLNYISHHQIPAGSHKDYQLINVDRSFTEMLLGVPEMHWGIDYPTSHAYSLEEWKHVSDFIANQCDINEARRLRDFIQDVIDFNEMEKAEYLAARKSPLRPIECHVEVDGFLIECMGLNLTEAEAGTLFYLYNLALATDLNGLNEEAVEEKFFPWLENHHPKVAKALVRAAEVELADRLAEDIDGLYRNNIPCIAPNSIKDGWSVKPDLKYHFILYDVPMWK